MNLQVESIDYAPVKSLSEQKKISGSGESTVCEAKALLYRGGTVPIRFKFSTDADDPQAILIEDETTVRALADSKAAHQAQSAAVTERLAESNARYEIKHALDHGL